MTRATDRGLRVLMLASDAHGSLGGIAQFNRDVIHAMSSISSVDEVVVLPRLVQDPVFNLPDKVKYDLAGAGSAGAYLKRCTAYLFAGGHYDFIYCAHINLVPVAALLAKIRRIPLVLAIYGIDAWQKPRGCAGFFAPRTATLVVSISQITVDRYRGWSKIARERCVLLPNAIHSEQYGTGPKDSLLARRLGVANRPVILTFGRMSADERYKGFDQVIEIMPRLRARLPNLVYVAAGDGSDRPRLEAKANSLGVGASVVFPGRISETEKSDLYRLADAYVMPSSGEGFGFVVLEALACGIPVVASTADGTREAVRGGELGLLVDPLDMISLEDAIFEALSRPKGVPPGLNYFSFANFQTRLAEALGRVVPVCL